MKRAELEKRVEAARCRVLGWQDARYDGQRMVVAAVIDAFDNSESAVLVEPSLSRTTTRPPDVVLIDPEVGVQVIEVKGLRLHEIEKVEAGGKLTFRYEQRVRINDPIEQVRQAMFAIRDATLAEYPGALSIPFRYWVVFPRIKRADWIAKFGATAFRAPEYLFADDLDRHLIIAHFRATDRVLDKVAPVRTCRLEELQCVWTAFGDNSVLYVTPEQRPLRRARAGTLGEHFDALANRLKHLSEDQKRLSEMHWDNGPRLIRGVAGSGKTVVLANNLARRAKLMLAENTGGLFGPTGRKPRIAAVCFNRALAPFLLQKISQAYQQRTGERSVPDIVTVCSFNRLMHLMRGRNVWTYQSTKNADPTKLAQRYREQLTEFRQRTTEAFDDIGFDAIYVDEGQDFLHAEFELLRDLCITSPGREPNLYVFYDDAQNLYGRARPNWASLGLNVRGGRAFVMAECFRNTRQIVETTFNVLYGTAVKAGREVPTREFGDIATLQDKRLIALEDGRWRVKFAPREGRRPMLTLATDAAREISLIVSRLLILLRDQTVRPQDILIISVHKDRAGAIAEAIERENISGVAGVHRAFVEKDTALCPPGFVTVSTVHSAKGYDAYVVLLASANEFDVDVRGRACFYVACTRAIEHLEVLAYNRGGLVGELDTLLSEASARPPNGP